MTIPELTEDEMEVVNEFTVTERRWFRAMLWLQRKPRWCGLPYLGDRLLRYADARGWKPLHVEWHGRPEFGGEPTVAVWRREKR